jgi:hypothetical protein
MVPAENAPGILWVNSGALLYNIIVKPMINGCEGNLTFSSLKLH